VNAKVLCIIVAALAVVTQARVPLLPGWMVPVPVVLLLTALALAASLAALIVLQARAVVPVSSPPPAPEHAAEVTP
jgi:hypothetical protein